MTKNKEIIRRMAKDDVIVDKALQIYDHGEVYETFEDFLIDLIMMLALAHDTQVKLRIVERMQETQTAMIKRWRQDPQTNKEMARKVVN
jgi:hypothetical protein